MNDMTFKGDFAPKDIVVHEQTRRGSKWSYFADFKGVTRLHIREVYQDDNDAWCPTAKGVSFGLDTEFAKNFAVFAGHTMPGAEPAKPVKKPKAA